MSAKSRAYNFQIRTFLDVICYLYGPLGDPSIFLHDAVPGPDDLLRAEPPALKVPGGPGVPRGTGGHQGGPARSPRLCPLGLQGWLKLSVAGVRVKFYAGVNLPAYDQTDT